MGLLITLLIIAAAGGILAIKMRSSGGPDRPRAKTARRASAKARSDFHAVSICMDASPCHAIRKYAGLRLLSGEAPALPLPDCDQRDCSCRFEHYTDRRSGDNRRDRVVAIGRMSSGEATDERRSWKDRRASNRT